MNARQYITLRREIHHKYLTNIKKKRYAAGMKKNAELLLFSALTISVVSGCYGPDYRKPPINMPVKWNSSDKLSQTSHANLPMMAWWEQFHDPQLSFLVSKALQNNNDIHAAIGNVMAAKGQLESVQFSWMPSVNGIFGHTNTKVSMLNPGYNADFLPSYAFNLFQFIRSKEYAQANVASANAAKDAVRLSIISQTVGGYFSYLAQSELENQQKQLVSDLKNLLFLSKKQYEKGFISLYVLQQYEQQYAQAKADLPIIQNNIVVSRNALRLLLNENPGPIQKGSNFMNLKSKNIIPVNLPSKVLQNRPDVREAEQNLVAANANIGIAETTFFPSITLTGAAGSASDQLSGLFSSSSDFWNHATMIDMPLLSPQTYGQIKQAKGEYYATYHQYIQTVRTAFQSVDNDLSAHDKYYTSFMEQMQYYDSTRKAYDLAKISYEKGLYSYPTVLQNKVQLDDAAIMLTKSKLAQLNTIVQLYQDLGGGYKTL